MLVSSYSKIRDACCRSPTAGLLILVGQLQPVEVHEEADEMCTGVHSCEKGEEVGETCGRREINTRPTEYRSTNEGQVTLKSTNQQINKSTNQQINKSTNQQINKSTNQQINKSTNQQINKSTNQPTNQPTNQSINQSICMFIFQHRI